MHFSIEMPSSGGESSRKEEDTKSESTLSQFFHKRTERKG